MCQGLDQGVFFCENCDRIHARAIRMRGFAPIIPTSPHRAPIARNATTAMESQIFEFTSISPLRWSGGSRLNLRFFEHSSRRRVLQVGFGRGLLGETPDWWELRASSGSMRGDCAPICRLRGRTTPGRVRVFGRSSRPTSNPRTCRYPDRCTAFRSGR